MSKAHGVQGGWCCVQPQVTVVSMKSHNGNDLRAPDILSILCLLIAYTVDPLSWLTSTMQERIHKYVLRAVRADSTNTGCADQKCDGIRWFPHPLRSIFNIRLRYTYIAFNFTIFKCTMIVSTFRELWSHHHSLALEHFHHPEETCPMACFIALAHFHPQPSPRSPFCLSVSPFLHSHINGIIQCVVLCVWILFLSLKFSRFISLYLYPMPFLLSSVYMAIITFCLFIHFWITFPIWLL